MTRDERILLNLLRAMASFADSLAVLRQAQDRLHQAHAALAAATELRVAAARLASQRMHQLPLPFDVSRPGAAQGAAITDRRRTERNARR